MAENNKINMPTLAAAMAYTNSHGGGGGGTSNYNDLSNKPQIGGVTLSGDKSASDLGLASTTDLAGKVDKVEGYGLSENDYTDADAAIVAGVTAALAGKQDALTAGSYIAIENDSIRVNRTLANPIVPYTYRVHTTSTDGTYASVDIDKKDESGVVLNSVHIWYYEHQGIANAVTMDDFIQIYYDGRWICNLLKNSETHQAGYQQVWNWNQSVDFSEVYDMEVDLSGQKLIIKDEMDSALADKQDTLTFDSVPTNGSTKPVESNGVYDALATKANQTQLATVEASTTASKAYSTNEYLVLGGVLYKVTANIAQGGTIVTEGAGKNVDLATVGGELSAINSNILTLSGAFKYAEYTAEYSTSDLLNVSVTPPTGFSLFYSIIAPLGYNATFLKVKNIGVSSNAITVTGTGFVEGDTVSIVVLYFKSSMFS